MNLIVYKKLLKCLGRSFLISLFLVVGSWILWRLYENDCSWCAPITRFGTSLIGVEDSSLGDIMSYTLIMTIMSFGFVSVANYKRWLMLPYVKDIETGFNHLQYPIIGFGGNWAEPMGINDYEEYRREYLIKEGGFGAKKIIDAKLCEYKVVFKKIFIKINQKIEYEDVLYLKETDIDSLKRKILKHIKQIGSSCYSGLEDKIANVQSVSELVSVLNKGVF